MTPTYAQQVAGLEGRQITDFDLALAQLTAVLTEAVDDTPASFADTLAGLRVEGWEAPLVNFAASVAVLSRERLGLLDAPRDEYVNAVHDLAPRRMPEHPATDRSAA